ncbi:unnamed protein product [Mytilus coruscus]|uniref:Ig-like domain-containing protein n=1 Tax=Mytilus coruscus TaxID=42192 RepID=A0A6J8E4D9_MYTCO|nr:unnamed protein product [Mytilus coruscus]
MENIVYVIFLLQVVCVIAENSRTIQYANIDESVILICQQSKPAEGLRWLRNNVILTDGQQISHMSPWHEKITIYHKKNVGQYNLRIANVTADDFGDYLCEMQIDKEVSNLLVRLKNKAAIADLQAHKKGRFDLIFNKDVGEVLKEATSNSLDEKGIIKAKSAKIIQRDMLDTKNRFTGTFNDSCQHESVP